MEEWVQDVMEEIHDPCYYGEPRVGEVVVEGEPVSVLLEKMELFLTSMYKWINSNSTNNEQTMVKQQLPFGGDIVATLGVRSPLLIETEWAS